MGRRSEETAISKADKQFFQQLFEEYKDFLYYIAGRYATETADREDTVQHRQTDSRAEGELAVIEELKAQLPAKDWMILEGKYIWDIPRRSWRNFWASSRTACG